MIKNSQNLIQNTQGYQQLKVTSYEYIMRYIILHIIFTIQTPAEIKIYNDRSINLLIKEIN